MKLIHTADWHIGKLLLDQSRLEEQKIVLDELVQLADENNVDAVCIAGDIYDNGNPSALAEELFCETVEKLSKHGKRLVVIIAGNHDKPQRLEALHPLAKEHGILILGTPMSALESGTYGGFTIESLDAGVFKTQINGEGVVFACVPYASEKLLGEVIYHNLASEEENIKDYEEKMKSVYKKCNSYFMKETINICMSHVFTLGYEGDSSERSTQLGGSYLLDANVFPEQAQYIALGHVHKPQKVQGTHGRARYSGSILPYHSDEVKTPKQCNLVEIHVGKDAEITPLYLSNPKPIERWYCNGYEEARQKCEENKDRECWVFLKIKTDGIILEDQIKELKGLKKDILEIMPVFADVKEEEVETIFRQEENLIELFKGFYKSMQNVEPDEEMLMLLQKLAGEEEV